MLDIFVIPVEIDVSQIKPVELVQSESSVYISDQFLNVTTNGKRSSLQYEIVEPPSFGRIMLKGLEARQFTQMDVDASAVLYIMDNFSASEDSFLCHIFMEKIDVALKNQTVPIVVKPLITQSVLIAPGGATVAITKASLDATELATRTGDNPTF
nr:hypothetical protein BaRGS_010840 [Batillaria attramentaria]